MRRLCRLLLAILVWLGMAPVAAAGTLASASFTFEFDPFYPFNGWVTPGGTIAGVGVAGWSAGQTSVSLVGGSGLAGTLSFIGGLVISAPPFTDLTIFVGSHAPGVFSGATPNAVGGVLPFQGHACLQAFGGLCLLDVTILVGNTITHVRLVSAVGQTTRGSPWMVGLAQVQRTQATPSGATVLSRVGYNGLDANGIGTLVLVSALNVTTNLGP